MIWQALPPVRRPVPLTCDRSISADSQWAKYFPGRTVTGYQSGTQALQAAIVDSLMKLPVRSKIIIPAYACPDLLAACVGAGADPVIVDVYANEWGYDLQSLKYSMDRSVAAIIAVNYLGVGDQAKILRSIADANGSLLIQDSAQCLPKFPNEWLGDYVVTSFGRGKPLNLLGGGLVAASQPLNQSVGKLREGKTSKSKEKLKAAIFNFVTDRRVFPWICKLSNHPIGETKYKIPTKIIIDESVTARAGMALAAYLREKTSAYKYYMPYIENWRENNVYPLLAGGSQGLEESMLRLPLLAKDKVHRETILTRLTLKGLGASAMYRKPISEIDGIPIQYSKAGPFSGAENLSNRILTLPIHGQVRSSDVKEIDRIIRNS